MTPQDRQDRLVTQLRLFEDAHERLAFIQDKGRQIPVLPQEYRTESYRVTGCVTRVWMLCRREGAVCTFAIDSESSMVRGLALLVCEIYSGCRAADIVSFSSSLMALAGLDRVVTPTRLHGLQRVEEIIRQFARGVHDESSSDQTASTAL